MIKDLASNLARKIFEFGDELGIKCSRIEFKGEDSTGERGMGGLCEEALSRLLERLISGYSTWPWEDEANSKLATLEGWKLSYIVEGRVPIRVGWTLTDPSGQVCTTKVCESGARITTNPDTYRSIPNYCEDLNATARIEAKVTDHRKYASLLSKHSSRDSRYLYSAGPRDKVKALVEYFNL